MTLTAEAFRMRVAKNLHRLLDQKGCPQTGYGRAKTFSADIGVSVPCVSKWLTGHSTPEAWRYEFLVRYFDCNYDELLGEPGIAPKELVNFAEGSGSALLVARLPGNPNQPLRALDDELQSLEPGPIYVRSVDTDEMSPYVAQGDLALVVHEDEMRGDDVYVFRDHRRGKYILRRVYERVSGGVALLTENERYPSEEIDLEDSLIKENFWLCGRVVGRVLVGR